MKINSINSINTNLNSQKRHPQFQGIVLSDKVARLFDDMNNSNKASLWSVELIEKFVNTKINAPDLGKEGEDLVVKINDFTDEFVDGARKVSINYEVPALAKLGKETKDSFDFYINTQDNNAKLPEFLLIQKNNSLGYTFLHLINTIKRKANLDI